MSNNAWAAKPASNQSGSTKTAVSDPATGVKTSVQGGKARVSTTGPVERPGLADLLKRLAGSQADIPADLVELGRIGDPYGIKGWVNVFPHSDDSQALAKSAIWYLQRYAGGASRPTASAPVAVMLEQRRMHSGRLVAQLRGVDSRNDAECLKGLSIWVSRRDFPPLRKGEFYWVDLVGLSVINREGVLLGTVTEVTDHGAHPILCIQRNPAVAVPDIEPDLSSDADTDEPDEAVAGGQVTDAGAAQAHTDVTNQADDEMLIPFVPAYIDRVDLPSRTIAVDWQPDY